MTQTAHCRLDQVLLTFGLLYHEYSCLLRDDPANEGALRAIIDSLEKRWSKCDQDVFIAALIMNPQHRTAPLAKIVTFNNAAILALLNRLWLRFYQAPAPTSLFQEFMAYMGNHGLYENFPVWVASVVNDAESNVCFFKTLTVGKYLNTDLQKQSPDPLKMYEGVAFGNEVSPLCKLAQRLLSICANSASCERLFSMFGLILTRLRSRLRTKAMADLAELRLHLRDEHLRQGLIKARLQRSTTSHENAATGALEPQETSSVPVSQQPPSAAQDDPNTQQDASTDETNGQTFHVLAESFIQQVDEDEDFNDVGNQPQGSIQIRIADIFNFSNNYWTTHLKAFASRSLNDELELYELIEAESDGDVSAGPEMDEMVEASVQ